MEIFRFRKNNQYVYLMPASVLFNVKLIRYTHIQWRSQEFCMAEAKSHKKI